MPLNTSVAPAPRQHTPPRPTGRVRAPQRAAADRRDDRAAARRVVWAESRLPRLRDCGRVAVTQDGRIGVRASTANGTRVAGYAGLASCGSVWACPCCSAKVMTRRREEVAAALAAAEARGLYVVMVTLTVRHRAGQPLAQLWDAVSKGWAAATSGAAWAGGKERRDGSRRIGDKERFGVVGYIRATEVTHGVNGWHPHIHVLLLLDQPTSQAGAEVLGLSLWSRWDRALRRLGFDSRIVLEVNAETGEQEMTGGLRAQVIRDGAEPMADYFTKAVYSESSDQTGDIASEVTLGGLSKSGRLGNRTPMQLLREIVNMGDADDLDLWHEWEAASKGRRALVWSHGLRELLGLDAEQTDEDIAAEELGTADDTVVVLPGETWTQLRDARLEGELLRVVEQHGDAALRPWLAGRGLVWLEPDEL